MKKFFLTTLSLSLMIGFLWTQTSCNRHATPAKYTGRQLILGNGGGITGFSTAYYLLANGKMFSRSSRDTVFTFLAYKPDPIQIRCLKRRNKTASSRQ